jgi:hypothetical protein
MTAISAEAEERALLAVFDRDVPLDALAALERSLTTSAPGRNSHSLGDTAVALDTNVLLKLASHRKSSEVIDYLTSKHEAPLILPGQVIQEFWNNHVGSLMTVAKEIERKLADLQKSINELEPHGPLSDAVSQIKEQLSSDYNFLFDAGLVSKTKTMLASLRVRARVPFAKRSAFVEIAELRKRTKTPPGFRDDGHGDFYVWVDLLKGLQQARAEGSGFVQVAVITNDEKPDWVRNGMAHPILSSEVRSLFNVPLEIWKLDRLVEEVDRALTVTVTDPPTDGSAGAAEG